MGPDGAIPDAPASTFLFEVAWEVCNQVGGIYQVVRSKVPLMSARWHERYCMVGPYIEGKAQLEFEPSAASGWLSMLLAQLSRRGLKVHHGHWLIQGRPRVLLLESGGLLPSLGALKHLLWEHHGIASPAADPLIDAAVMFGAAVEALLELAQQEVERKGAAHDDVPRRLLVHFHEWQGSLALPELRLKRLPIASVFTTHATMLGRYIASSEDDFYERLDRIDAGAAAERYNIRTQHAVERACAQSAHVFTTVSRITAEECKALLGRPPDLVTPNGLNIARFNVGHDFQTYHADFKAKIHSFTMGYFFPHHSFDLDRTLYVFTSGRYEPHNKGFDLCLEALQRLNAQLKAVRLGVTLVFFIVTARPTRSIHPLVLEKRGILNELHEVCDSILERVGDELFEHAARGHALRLDELIEEYWQLRYRRTQAAFRTDVLPPIVTHILHDDQHDAVLDQIRKVGLFNHPDDPVKVVYHPEFIAPVSPLWGIEYEQFVRGCHLGLFPSAYEPWGYTPLECMALGTPAVSSDLAGFGRYVKEAVPQHDRSGLFVLSRRGKSFDEAAADLSNRLFEFCMLSRRDRVALRNEVERHSWEFDWSKLGPAYHRAHDLALERGEE